MEVSESKYRLACELKRKINCSYKMTNVLYEYFQYNMGTLDGFYPEYDEITRSRTYILDGQELPHYLNQEEANGEFHYYPSEPVFISDAVHSEQETVCFLLEVLRSEFLLRKDYISSSLAIVEKYDCSNGVIEARVYDSESLIERTQNIQESITTGKRRFIESLMQKDVKGPRNFIRVYRSKNISGTECVIEDCAVGEETPTKIIVNGGSLYSEYYNYMVRKGYFTDDDSVKQEDSAKRIVKQGVQ